MTCSFWIWPRSNSAVSRGHQATMLSRHGTDTGRLLLVNRTQWRKGFKRELLIETDRDIQKRQNVMVVSMRVAFAERSGTRASATHTAAQYNITGV